MIDRAADPEKASDTFIVGNVGRDSLRTQPVCSRFQALYVARSDDDIGAFALRQFSGGKSDAGLTSNNNNLLAFKQHGLFLLICRLVGTWQGIRRPPYCRRDALCGDCRGSA